MEYYSLNDYKIKTPAVAALGFFDGVHTGHKKLLELVKQKAKEKNYVSLAVTFDKHPANFLTDRCISPIITDDAEKIRQIKISGIDNIIFLPFDDNLAGMNPEQFVKSILKDRLNVEVIICGFHYSFGKGGQGTVNDLIDLGRKYNIKVEVVPPVLIDNVVVSSSYIRNMLQTGDMEEAAKFLGRRYAVEFTVVEGKRIGRKMGIPTINQDFPMYSVIPLQAVYATIAYADGQKVPAVSNVGMRPTVNDGTHINIETHLIGGFYDLYGKNVRVEFIKKIRNETRFQNLTTLKNQIQKDIDKSLIIYNNIII